jgi:hypothetical protein
MQWSVAWNAFVKPREKLATPSTPNLQMWNSPNFQLGSVLRHNYDNIDADMLWRSVAERLDPLEHACRRELAGTLTPAETAMEIDKQKIDETVLALLYLGLHDRDRVWKSFDWDAMNRLHEKGFISKPVGKAKSVALTEEGRAESERLFNALFAKK